MSKLIFCFLLLFSQNIAAQYKITTLSDLAYNVKYNCKGEGWAISDTSQPFPFRIIIDNRRELNQLNGSPLAPTNCPIHTWYDTCELLYLDKIRGEVDIITDFSDKIDCSALYALIQKDSFWRYNHHAGIEFITTRINFYDKKWKMNAMSKIAFAHQLADKILPKSSIQTRSLVVALALSPSVAYYDDFRVKRWRDINISLGVVSVNNVHQIHIATLSKIRPTISINNADNIDSSIDTYCIHKYAKRKYFSFLKIPQLAKYSVELLDDKTIYMGLIDSAKSIPPVRSDYMHFWANKDITYEDMLFSGQIIPSFPDMNYTEHTMQMKFRDSSYLIRYKTSASLATHLSYMPHIDNFYNYAAFPLSDVCEKSLKKAFLPILKTLENEAAQKEFIKAFCVKFIQITENGDTEGIFPEELLHLRPRRSDNDAIGVLYAKLCHVLLKNKEYHIPISRNSKTLNKYEAIIRTHAWEAQTDLFKNY
jgi:hypothetical protein